jgi:hypothetical protein
MADDSEAVTETLKVRMRRVTGKNKETQWFEYRPSFTADIVRISWELDTMDVELDAPIADYLLRAGYATPIPQGSAPVAASSTPQPVPKPAAKPVAPPQPAADPSPPPTAPSWLKPSGDNKGDQA